MSLARALFLSISLDLDLSFALSFAFFFALSFALCFALFFALSFFLSFAVSFAVSFALSFALAPLHVKACTLACAHPHSRNAPTHARADSRGKTHARACEHTTPEGVLPRAHDGRRLHAKLPAELRVRSQIYSHTSPRTDGAVH